MPGPQLRLGTIRGFEVHIHWSTLVIFGLLVWSLAAVQLPEQAPEASGGANLVAALVAGLAFYGALLAHEVSHAVLARREGIEVHGLTLWLLGGVASLKGEPKSPGADLRIAGIGPAVSLGLGLAFGAAAVVAGVGDAADVIVATLAWLSGINLVLGVFNLIPAAPLDGGRLLRAALWRWRGDRTWAAVTAARAGEAFGYTLMGVGLLSLFIPGFRGLWFLVLGWFVLNAARAEQAQAILQETMGDLPISRVMTAEPVTAPATATVAEVLDDDVLATRHSAFPLRDEAGRTVGLVTLDRLRQVAPEERHERAVIDVACAIDDLTTASPDERLLDVLPRLNRCGDGRVLVLEHGRLVGIVTPTDVSRTLEVGGLLQEGELRRSGRR